MNNPGDMPPKPPPPPMGPPPGMPPPGQPPYGTAPVPYGYGAPPPPPKSNTTKWVLIGCGILGALGILCCGGFAGMGWYAWKQIQPMIEDTQKLANANPVMQEHIGTLADDGFQMRKAEFKNDNGVVEADVRGDKGSGHLTINWHKRDGKWRLRDAVLTMADGTKHLITETDVK